MPIPADHVRNDKAAAWREGALDLPKQSFQVHNMMQGLVGNHSVVRARGLPIIKIGLDEAQSIRDSVLIRRSAAAFQHGWIQIQAIDDKILPSFVDESLGQSDLEIAVAGPHAHETNHAILPRCALFLQIFLEHSNGTAEAENLELRTNCPVGPVMKNRGEIVDVNAILEDVLLGCHASFVLAR